jgi:hypothetical protein
MSDLELWLLCRSLRDGGDRCSGGVVRASLTDIAGIWPEHRVICCDGSDTVWEWIGNFLVHRTTKNGAHVSYERAARGLMAYMVSVARAGETWTIAGHSRGGGIARVLSVLMARMGVTVRCVTFGAPPSGREKFNRLMTNSVSSAISYEIDGDIVTRLPMWWPRPSGFIAKLPRQHKGVKANHMAYGEALAGECSE